MNEVNKSGFGNAWAGSREVAQGYSKKARHSRVMRPLALALPIVLLSVLTGCGEDATTPTATAGSSATTSDSAGGAAGSELTAVVGQEGDVDAFKITLMDGAGAEVTTLPAGDYTVKVKDLSKIHNFHLTGTGVEETTTVPEVADVTWTVTFTAGTYTFKCDPHAKMTGTFTVT